MKAQILRRTDEAETVTETITLVESVRKPELAIASIRGVLEMHTPRGLPFEVRILTGERESRIEVFTPTIERPLVIATLVVPAEWINFQQIAAGALPGLARALTNTPAPSVGSQNIAPIRQQAPESSTPAEPRTITIQTAAPRQATVVSSEPRPTSPAEFRDLIGRLARGDGYSTQRLTGAPDGRVYLRLDVRKNGEAVTMSVGPFESAELDALTEAPAPLEARVAELETRARVGVAGV